MAFSPQSGAVQDAAQSTQQTPLVHIAGVPRPNGVQSCLRCLEELPNAAAVPGAYLLALYNDRYAALQFDGEHVPFAPMRCSPVEAAPIPNLLETPLDILPPITTGYAPVPLRSDKLGQACYLGEHGMCMRLNCDCRCHADMARVIAAVERANGTPAIEPKLPEIPYAFNANGLEIFGEWFLMRVIPWQEIQAAMWQHCDNPQRTAANDLARQAQAATGVTSIPPELLADLTQDQAGTVAKILKKGEEDDALIMCSDCKTQPAISCGLCAGCMPF